MNRHSVKMERLAVDQLLTLPEVAARLRRPVATVRYWRTLGTGPPSAKIGNRVVYRSSDLERWIEEQFAGPA